MASTLHIRAIRAALEFHMDRAGLTGKQLSKAAKLNETAVRDLLGKVKDPRLSTLLQLAEALNISPETLFGGSTEIVGNINKHGEILPIPANGKPREIVPRPPEVVGELLAYRVAGDGLFPAFWDGDVVYVSREHEAATEAYVGMECAVQIAATGATLLRTIESVSAPGRFTLSLSKTDKKLDNVQLAWAAPVLFVMRHRPGKTVAA